ncbi:DNA mismatch repair protein MutL [Pseudidiomarina planktonica]|uniref:DNA mismatch repair protein MutL n=1 Tax=Pseudidiomarina planktonica TaxID=1323738 RepID=A0A1Y6EIL7_9GAMM|nr:DNA mismatch repair endonuclease MutL [Pseudidiomarina planktonica]RUO66164.1 DNA mismatch repair protein MutL [Pseudidiomarina planktonica]SMQ59993.1 DNA mismatch repair protein MutL [Pseudidiomarina planktonica]
MPIQLLPISLANQIAAGEVVERPASVVKELIENSIDAGATQIEIDIEQGGAKRIRLRDNGAGIVQDELALALSRHATSKISSLDDLEAIQSLGFRGEALASISSVSRLRLTSKPPAQETAWQAWVEGRDMEVQTSPAAHPDGTTVDVVDLFYNTPARRKFLRTAKTEFSHIDEVIRRIALVRFDVALTLRHNQKEVRQYRRADSDSARQQRLAQICGKAFAAEALQVKAEHDQVQLRGWIAPAASCRHQSDIQYLYVNGRMMRDRLLLHAVRQAYADTLAEDRSPSFVLYLELPAIDVDVNVHPAKHEVRFHRARQIHDFVVQALRPALVQSASEHSSESMDVVSGHQYSSSQSPSAAELAEFKPRSAHPLPGMRPAPAPAALHANTQLLSGGASPKPVGNPPLAATPAATGEWQLLTVFQQRFALLSRPESLALLNLQQVQRDSLLTNIKRQADQGLNGQPLLVPVKITTPDIRDQFATLHAPLLAQLGLQIQAQRNAIEVQQVPAMLRQTDITRTIAVLFQHLLQQPDAQQPQELADSLWQWLVSFQVQSDYSATQAEHWLQCWQQNFNSSNHYLTPVQLPQLPPELSQ